MSGDIEDIDQVSIVLLGMFEPERLHPNETVMQDLLTPGDIEHLRVTVLLPKEIIEFQTQFFVMHVSHGRLSVQSKLSAPIPQKVRDFAVDLLSEIQVPITAMGINRDLHFRVRSADKYKAVRDELLNHDNLDDVLKNGLIRSLLLESDRYDTDIGKIFTRIEPSVALIPGMFIQVNDHATFGGGTTSHAVSQSLSDRWTRASENANLIVAKMRSLTE
jgi:hypothetical protein